MRKYLFVALVAVTTLFVSFLPKASVENTQQSLRFSPEICPASSNSTQIIVAGVASKVQVFRGKKSKVSSVKKAFTILQPQPNDWMEISESAGAPVMVDRTSGLSLLACPGIAEPSWFVGGASDVSSQDQLVLANDGASPATLLVKMWSTEDRAVETTVTVNGRTSKKLRLDTLAPGVKAMVLYIEPQVGRVSISLQSKRQIGLKSSGADYISANAAPSLDQVIPVVLGIEKIPVVKPTTKAKKKGKKATVTQNTITSTRTLRVLVPGESPATFTATLLTNDGTYIPVGLDQVSLESGRVREFTFTTSVPTSLSALHVTSDVPIVASVNNRDADYAWSPAVTVLEKESSVLMPPKATLALVGTSGTTIAIITSGSKGATSLSVSSDKLTTWVNASKDWSLVRISSDGTIHGSVVVSDLSGKAILPIRNRVRVGSGSLPISDLSITRGGASLPTSG